MRPSKPYLEIKPMPALKIAIKRANFKSPVFKDEQQGIVRRLSDYELPETVDFVVN